MRRERSVGILEAMEHRAAQAGRSHGTPEAEQLAFVYELRSRLSRLSDALADEDSELAVGLVEDLENDLARWLARIKADAR